MVQVVIALPCIPGGASGKSPFKSNHHFVIATEDWEGHHRWQGWYLVYPLGGFLKHTHARTIILPTFREAYFPHLYWEKWDNCIAQSQEFGLVSVMQTGDILEGCRGNGLDGQAEEMLSKQWWDKRGLSPGQACNMITHLKQHFPRLHEDKGWKVESHSDLQHSVTKGLQKQYRHTWH